MSYQEQTTQDQTVDPLRDDRLATHDLLDTLAADGSFNRFLAALKTVGLEGHLRGPDMTTLIAPTDQAFDQMDQPTDPGRLGSIIRYHVIPGARSLADIRIAPSLPTLEGSPLTVLAGGAHLTRTDIVCTNGIIHATGTVLLP